MNVRNRLAIPLLLSHLLGASVARADPSEPSPTDDSPKTPPSPDAQPKKPAGPVSNIEDAALEGLMGMNLEDKLGQTEAVSRSNESVLRAPATITSLDATQIRLSGATTVPDLLRFVPGVVVYRSAPGSYIVSLRGTGGIAGNNIILLIDGIPINSPADGTVSWDLVPVAIEDIERVEVVRGPVSPTYGANAYTGVINIVTRTSLGLSPHYAVRARGGLDQRGDGAGAVSGRFMHVDKKLELKWFMNAERDGTFSTSSAFGGLSFPPHPPLDHASMATTLAYKVSRTGKVSVEFGQSWGRRSSLDHFVLNSAPQSQHLTFGRAAYEIADPDSALSNCKVWVQGLSLTMRQPGGAEAGFSYGASSARRVASGADVVVALHKSVSLLAGGQGSAETVDAAYLHPKVDGRVQTSFGFYGGVKASPLKSLDFVVSGRGDRSPISTEMAYSYRASAIYYRDTWSVRLTGASAFRNPTYVEAAGRFIDPATGYILLEGTSTLASPRNTSVELGANFSPLDTLTLSPTIYLSKMSNLMVEDFESVLRRTFRNDATARTFVGGELEASWRISDSLTALPSFTALHWLEGERSSSNVGVPDQNSKFVGGLRLQGVFGNERWGYGIGGTVASPRTYNVRTGIPPVVLSREIPTTARLSAMIERQLSASPAIWTSLRLGASFPSGTAESPTPISAPLGQSAILGIEVRRE